MDLTNENAIDLGHKFYKAGMDYAPSVVLGTMTALVGDQAIASSYVHQDVGEISTRWQILAVTSRGLLAYVDCVGEAKNWSYDSEQGVPFVTSKALLVPISSVLGVEVINPSVSEARINGLPWEISGSLKVILLCGLDDVEVAIDSSHRQNVGGVLNAIRLALSISGA